MSKHILVLGATGPSGLAFCHLALEKGHKLTIYARNLSKLPASISENSNVLTFQGRFDDETGLQKAAQSGAEVFVSFAGPLAYRNHGIAITECYKLLIPLLIAQHYTRALILSTPSFTIPEDKMSWLWKVCITLIKIVGGTAYEEIVGLSAYISSQPIDKLKWTLFRVPFLRNGEAIRRVKASYLGSGEDGMVLDRESTATWILEEIREEKWVGKAPFLSH